MSNIRKKIKRDIAQAKEDITKAQVKLAHIEVDLNVAKQSETESGKLLIAGSKAIAGILEQSLVLLIDIDSHV